MTVLEGAEPYSADGSPTGVLVLHGFTGSPQSMRGLAEAFAAAGYTVELPLLPGHGTSVADMEQTRFSDWATAAEQAWRGLQARCDRVVVAGLSMGGTLTAWLAARHPEIAGLIAVNPAVEPLDETAREQIAQSLAAGIIRWPAVGGDIAEPGQQELAYDEVPVVATASLADALDELQAVLGDISCPVLVFWSPQDHVVTNASSQLLIQAVKGPAELVTLPRSYHVATLDFDRELIIERALGFVAALESPARQP